MRVSWQELRLAAELSTDVYSAPSMTTVSGNTRSLYLPADDDLPAVLAIAGTDDLRDALQDVDIRREGAGAHRGFTSHAKTIADLWVERLEPHAERDQLIITGHSLGGAVATIFAYLTGWRVRVITFGAPRALTRHGAERFLSEGAAKVLRLERAGDPVPHLPSALFGWRHVGRAERLGGSWLGTALRFAVSRWGGAIGAIEDHAIAKYLADVQERARGREDEPL